MPADANDARAGVVGSPKLGVFTRPHRHDVLYRAQSLHVVYDGRAHVETQHCREVRRLDPRIGSLSFERLDQARFLAADVCPSPTMNVNFQLVTTAQNVLSEKILRPRF